MRMLQTLRQAFDNAMTYSETQPNNVIARPQAVAIWILGAGAATASLHMCPKYQQRPSFRKGAALHWVWVNRLACVRGSDQQPVSPAYFSSLKYLMVRTIWLV